MIDNILILTYFISKNRSGELFFARYNNYNPAFFLVNNELMIEELTINFEEFYKEYPFGEYSLIVLRDLQIAGLLADSGIIDNPVFHANYNGEEVPVCELTGQMVDLLKEHGKYFV